MTLAASRIVFQGETPYAYERDAIQFAIDALPNVDPYHVWALVDLLEPTRGALYEIDLIVLGHSALYLVEIKSGPGRYEGDHQDWYRKVPGEPAHYLDNPLRLANHKAKVLKTRLRHAMKEPHRCPWIEPLIFLSDPTVEIALKPEGSVRVVDRKGFRDAVVQHQFFGAGTDIYPRIERPVMRDVVLAMAALGLRPRKGKLFAGSYELRDLIDAGVGYQDRIAVHREKESITRRARTYLVPQQTSVERRQQLRRAADREAELLEQLRDHQKILRLADYVSDAELGPTVLFDAFDGLTLDAFLRRHPNLAFADRVAILEQVARALAYCHQKRVLHGALSPQSVLVRLDQEGRPDARLFNFQLGSGQDVEATSHWSALASEPWLVYQAPELREDPGARTEASDVFSLAALAFFLFTGRAPAESIVDVDRILAEQRHLDPRLVDDGVPLEVAKVIHFGTERVVAERCDNATEWIELLLDMITRPDEVRAEINPLEVRKEEMLSDDLLVEEVIGHGATSRVLRVHRESDARSYALKISLSAEHDERLREEAEVLRKLRHSRIVELVDELSFAGRPCLLLTLAGEETLKKKLARDGLISLELASRYGEDLLHALEYLEEEGVFHRDLKPDNLGVGSLGKKEAHLTLFDFSLVRAPKKELALGTAAYRDPFLRDRKEYDLFAERWSAAITLHEMLTGIRPRFDDERKLVLAAESFDAAARDRLIAFFETALHRETKSRFESAEDMRRAWIAAFESESAIVSAPELDTGDLVEAIEKIEPTAPIDALPLSPRAKNALDRAGLRIASDLLDLPDNRLSAIRGIGLRVAQDILAFRNLWRAARSIEMKSEPFFPGYRGEDLMAMATIPEAAPGLGDAGLRTLAAIAATSKSQIEAIALRHGFDAAALHALLAAENARADEKAHPSTLEGWIDALLPTKLKREQQVRALFGIDGDFAGRLDVSVKSLADALSVTPALLYTNVTKCREQWAEHPALDELRQRALAILESTGGAVPIDRAADLLLAALPHDKTTEPKRAMSAALLRIVAEVDRDQPGMRIVRLHEMPWLFADDERVPIVRALGELADALAKREPLASANEVKAILLDAVKDSALATHPPERLAELAAAASEGAACSARLEIYPRDLAPERALDLSASVLKSGTTPVEIQQQIALRYPLAKALPERPELDRLLSSRGFAFDPKSGAYAREGEQTQTSLGTAMSSMERYPTAHPTQRLAMAPENIEVRQIDTQLKNALERHAFRVVAVPVERAPDIALALSERFGMTMSSFDELLVRAIQSQMEKKNVKRESLIHEADLAGPTGKSWRNLLTLANAAADEVMQTILPPKAPLLLIQPGLIARYELDALARALVGKPKEWPPIFLMVPTHSTSGLPRINGSYAIPGLLASQVLWVNRAWLANKHHEAA